MRNNQPITQRERTFPAQQRLISTTDAKGVITYCNDAFVEISGFSREELIRAPHNLVRHPDVPAAVFSHMWGTLKQGLPWMGIVKNRCKNGDHYWVNAYVTPVFDGNQVVGYESVRVKPTAEQIRRAEALYARMRADEADVARARAGDTAAFAALVRRHQDRVFGFILRMLDARDEAMELTQDVFVKAWQALPAWRPEARFSTWLLQIARNAALDQLRRRRVVQSAPLDDGIGVVRRLHLHMRGHAAILAVRDDRAAQRLGRMQQGLLHQPRHPHHMRLNRLKITVKARDNVGIAHLRGPCVSPGPAVQGAGRKKGKSRGPVRPPALVVIPAGPSRLRWRRLPAWRRVPDRAP